MNGNRPDPKMAKTYFQDFNRDDGTPITVEYSATGGEPNADCPGSICDGGGSGPEIVIVSAWPNTPEYNALQNDRYALAEHYFPALIRGRDPSVPGRIAKIDERLAAMEAACKLTDAEDERMSAWLAEHYVEEPYEPEF